MQPKVGKGARLTHNHSGSLGVVLLAEPSSPELTDVNRFQAQVQGP